MLNDVLNTLKPGWPMAAVIVVGVAVLVIVRRVLRARYAGQADKSLRIQLTQMVLSAVFMVVVIIASPLNDTRQGQILNLIGIVISAAIALSSTNIIGNAMAGLMIRVVRSFHVGDFITVGDHFGRVTERGLFHVEIQTEDRDLTTLPNTYLITHPVRVTYATGTLVWAEVSLGYDVSRTTVQDALKDAATAADLKEPFVHIMDLNDFAVVYRVVGLLPEVKHVLSARSRLREQMLDKLHAAGIEIVSPTFMNTRQLERGWQAMPAESPAETRTERASREAEALMFDKADKAASIEELRQHFERMGKDVSALEKELSAASTERERDHIKVNIERLNATRERLRRHLEREESGDDQNT